jgi:hypothetical protein
MAALWNASPHGRTVPSQTTEVGTVMQSSAPAIVRVLPSPRFAGGAHQRTVYSPAYATLLQVILLPKRMVTKRQERADSG